MSITRLISENRAEVILAALSFLSLVSLLSGTSSTFLQRGLIRVVSFSSYPFLAARTKLEEGVKYTFDFVGRYDELREESAENDALRTKLQMVLAREEELAAENRRLRDVLDFARDEDRLTLTPVRILENLRGMLTINRGRAHGIERHMAVITERGVVGVITQVHDLTSSVATLLHHDCQIAGMVYRNRIRAYDGVVKAGSDYSHACSMVFIDMKNDVRLGDVIVTSPESIFPAGLPIGTVTRVEETGGALWRWAEVEPAVDPYVLDEAMIITRYIPEERILAGGPHRDTYRDATSLAPKQPDERPVQERLAP